MRSTTPDIPLSSYLKDTWVFPVYEAFRVEGDEESQVGGESWNHGLRQSILTAFLTNPSSEVLNGLLDFYSNIRKHVPEKFWTPNPLERVRKN